MPASVGGGPVYPSPLNEEMGARYPTTSTESDSETNTEDLRFRLEGLRQSLDFEIEQDVIDHLAMKARHAQEPRWNLSLGQNIIPPICS